MSLRVAALALGLVALAGLAVPSGVAAQPAKPRLVDPTTLNNAPRDHRALECGELLRVQLLRLCPQLLRLLTQLDEDRVCRAFVGHWADTAAKAA